MRLKTGFETSRPDGKIKFGGSLLKTFRMRTKIFFLLSIILISIVQGRAQGVDSLRTRMLTPAEMRSDFHYLRRALEETHPGLYRYNTREQMRQEMDSLDGLLTGGMRFYDYYKLLASLIADIRCAHTTIFPAPDLAKLFSVCRVFPYGVIYIDNHVYLTLNASTDDVSVKPGFELLSINGRPIDSISPILFRHLWSDGYVATWKRRALVDDFFAFFYYLFVEQTDQFSFTCRNLQGEIIKKEVRGIPFTDYDKNCAHNPVNAALLRIYGPRSMLNRKKPWRVEYPKGQDAAILTIRGFGGGKNGDEAAVRMHTFMDASIKAINRKKVGNLIIDLRDNHGGWDNQGEILYTYLIDTPTYYYRRFHSVTDSSSFLKFSSLTKDDRKNIKEELIHEKDGTFTVKEQYNYTLSKQYPNAKRFKGKIWFLMNGASGSTTSEFLAVAHSNRLGVFVGEESTGNYTGGNGGEFITMKLPMTGMQVVIPLLYYDNAVRPPAQEGRGTMPDYTVPYNLKDVLSGTDTQLNFVFGLMRRENR
jgi:hypothetical protein